MMEAVLMLRFLLCQKENFRNYIKEIKLKLIFYVKCFDYNVKCQMCRCFDPVMYVHRN